MTRIEREREINEVIERWFDPADLTAAELFDLPVHLMTQDQMKLFWKMGHIYIPGDTEEGIYSFDGISWFKIELQHNDEITSN